MHAVLPSITMRDVSSLPEFVLLCSAIKCQASLITHAYSVRTRLHDVQCGQCPEGPVHYYVASMALTRHALDECGGMHAHAGQLQILAPDERAFFPY